MIRATPLCAACWFSTQPSSASGELTCGQGDALVERPGEFAPRNRWFGGPAEPEEPRDPRVVPDGPATTHLVVQPDHFDFAAEGLGGGGDLRQRPHLSGPHDLVFIEQEDGDVRDVDQFVDLTARPLPLFLLGEPVDPVFADAVCLVADDDVEFPGTTADVGIEVLEQSLDTLVSSTGVFPHGLGERFRARGVVNRQTSACELAEEAQRDDALPRAGPALHHDDRPGVRRTRAFDRVQDELVGDLLLVEEDELLSVLDFLRGQRQQRLGRPVFEVQELVTGRDVGDSSGAWIEERAQVVGELRVVVHREQPAVAVDLVVEERGHIRSAGVVQVRDTVHGPWALDKGGRVVGEVLAVAPYLLDGVQVPPGQAGHVQHLGQVELGLGPLLELHEDEGGLGGPRMDTAQDDIDPLTAVRQLVLQQDFGLPEASVRDLLQEDGQAPLPRVDLADPHPRPDDVSRLFLKPDVQVTGACFGKQITCAATDQSQWIPLDVRHRRTVSGAATEYSGARRAVIDKPSGSRVCGWGPSPLSGRDQM